MGTYIIEHQRHVRTVGEGAIASPTFLAWVPVDTRDAAYPDRALQDYLTDQGDRVRDGRYRVMQAHSFGLSGDEFTVGYRREFDVNRIKGADEGDTAPVVALPEAA